MNRTEIYLAKRNRIVVSTEAVRSIRPNSALVCAFQKNLESLGFILHPAISDALLFATEDYIVKLYNEVITALKVQVGAHKQFKPMYPNFPKQVAEANDIELYTNAMLHYFSAWVTDASGANFVILPSYDKVGRPKLNEETRLSVITLGSEADFNDIFTTLCSANSSISAADKDILKWFITNQYSGVLKLLPDTIPQKETLAFVLGEALKVCTYTAPLVAMLKTSTDILRVAVAMSGGDVSLAAPTKFIRMSRPTRKFFLQCLENCGSSLTEDMLRFPEQWKRLSRELRPGDYATKFPRAYEAFDVIRNDKPYETYNSGVEQALASGNHDKALRLLETRPGDFVRRLDHLLRDSKKNITTVRKLRGCVDKVSTPVLVQAYNHFAYRDKDKHRVFFPKGQVGKLKLLDKQLPSLDKGVSVSIANVIRTELVNRFSKLPSLGNCYIDDSLKTQLVPFAMRSASKALKTIARGSRMSLPDKNIVRFFLWWKNLESSKGVYDSRVDVDLSSVFLGKDFDNKGSVSYFNLRNGGYGCYHSGDITNAPNGACEFIDLDRAKLIKSGVYYVAMCCNMYTLQPFCNLPECFAGWMTRESANSGEIFDPKTVENKVDLAADTKLAIPVIIDLVNNCVIWTDLGLKNSSFINNVRTNTGGISLMAKAMADLNRPNLYDLFSMHIEGRGELVSTKAEANTTFSLNEGVTPFNTDLILSEYLK